MRESSEVPVDDARRLTFMREETRFEIGLLHDRINALIGAEAFLTIAFTVAMSSSNSHRGALFSIVVPPILSLVGLVLAVLAWPGVEASFKIIVEWSTRQRLFMQENPLLIDLMWRLEVLGNDDHRADPDVRKTMLFARAVPAVFSIAWGILTVIALALPFHAFSP